MQNILAFNGYSSKIRTLNSKELIMNKHKRHFRLMILCFTTALSFFSFNSVVLTQPVVREVRLGVAVSKSLSTDQKWKENFHAKVVESSKIFEKEIGVSFRPEIFWDWTPSNEEGDPEELLTELKKAHPLDSVDAVIGVRRVFGMLTTEQLEDIRALNDTQLFSGYILLAMPRKALASIRQEEVLAYVFAKLFGAIDSDAPHSVMKPVYNKSSLGIDDYNKEILLMTRNLNFKEGTKSLSKETINKIVEQYEKAAPSGMNAKFYDSLGQVYMQLGRNENAADAWLKGIDTDPANIGLYRDLADLYLQMGKSQEATNLILKGTQLDGQKIDVHQKADLLDFLGEIYMSRGDLDLAYQTWKQCMDLVPKHVGALVHIGILQLNEGKVDQAITIFNQASVADPENPLVLSGLAMISRSKGEFNKAIQLFRRALEQSPKQTKRGDLKIYDIDQPSFILGEMGLAYVQIKDFQRATSAIKQSCQMNPSMDCHRQLGEMYFQMERWDECIRELSAVIQVKKDDVKLFGVLGVALAKKGDFQRAVSLFREGLNYATSKGQKADLHRNLANLYSSANQFELAEREYLFAINSDSKNIDIYLGFVDLYIRNNMKPKASFYLQQAFKINPQDKRIKELQAKL
ncbi:MAG: hypothetical protein A3G33_02575 [Omnitrophica bacterium RIFCSPLOWO2_12_FULL_44_17]|uniref:Uncharacterized protein n=1 Tax=Candidatus Danuiimicrobium aquiferis TaxID=1801832 RepID=A0A1G1KZM1_9BACT|nr:MAG: hypothetical protein A3E74_07540 [Omnitrophica bacterium RIFCSPHIGHO2_12_FULL_44_12]OGW98340.1 MAG: hypothetical protein A3G33_02575 [Omnitrophica bacterium RIFCSPLOWO2_12_FULL_44_17]OGX02898.1 MAG: hypothetical protein A3J12_05080 [Omnitrophica bacterium RIFCSPLOWO2_02_FULL_44_11]